MADAHARHEALTDLDQGYPANYFAFQYVLDVLHARGAETLVEIGIGHGNAIPIFAEAGLALSGIDLDPELVPKSQRAMRDAGQDADRVMWGDIRDAVSLSGLHRLGDADALVAMGVLPHVEHEVSALANMRGLVKPGGTVFVECRNKLFSLFTFNRFTHEFVMDELLAGVSADVRTKADAFLRSRVDADVPAKPSGHWARFHNPLDIDGMFENAGFVDIRVKPFHYHAAMPRFEAELGADFRADSIALESETSGWRGLFLCSAFLVEARRPRSVSDE